MIIAQYKNTDLSKYNEFLNLCVIYEHNGIGVHEHHIIPRFMGGNDDESNLIKLSYKNHQLAHLILAECFDIKSREYKGNIFAAQHCSKWIQTNEKIDLREKISNIRKGIKRSPESIQKQKESRQKNGPYKWSNERRKRCTEQWDTKRQQNAACKAKLKELRAVQTKLNTEKRREIRKEKFKNGELQGSRKGVVTSAETKMKMSLASKKSYENGRINNRKGTTASDETRLKKSITMKNKFLSGEMTPSFKGKKHTEEAKGKQSQSKTGSRNPMSKQVKCNETGQTFGSAKDASIILNIPYRYMVHNIKKGTIGLSYIA